MKWKKRVCPISMKLDPYGSGWEDITLDICGDQHWWSVSGCLGDGFWALVESLYVLYSHQNHCEREEHRLSEEENMVGEYKNGDFIGLKPAQEGDKSYYSLPKQAQFYWDLEGHGVDWTLSRIAGNDRDFDLTIELSESDCSDNVKKSSYTVRYSDFCYAVGKAITEAVKARGFTGFHECVWESDVNIRHLCFIKACGLGKPDFFKPIPRDKDDHGESSSFTDEIELLLFDM